MTRVKELLNEYNLSPMAGGAISINFIFNSLFNPLLSNLSTIFNPLLSNLSTIYILTNKSSFGKTFFMHFS
jgi:hypothetical protein